jgi:multiple sugar transport system permease protein
VDNNTSRFRIDYATSSAGEIMNNKRHNYSIADIVALLCAIVMGIAFVAMPWTNGLEVEQSGYSLLSAISCTPGDITFMSLWLIPLAAILGGLAGAVGLLMPRQSVSKSIIFVAGAVGLIYYGIFLVQSSQNWQSLESLIAAFSQVGSGFFVVLIATIGLILQIFLPRIESSPKTVTAYKRRYPLSRTKRLEIRFGKDWKVAIPFILPVVVIMVGLVLYPFLNAISLSSSSLNFLTGETVGVCFRNYQKLTTNSDYLLSMQNTFQFTFWSLTVKFITGMTIALLLNSKLPYRNVLTGVMLLPWIVPEIVTALAWKSIYDPIFGGLNPILQSLGVIHEPLGWLSDPNLAMPSVILVNVWKGIPFYTMLLLAGLKAIDRELLEAAEVDGANAIKRFRHITLPSMRYVIVTTLLLSFISTFNSFGLIFLMTGGGPGGATRVYSILAWEKGIRSLQYGPGVAIAFSVAPLMMVLIWLLSRFMRQDEGHAATVVNVSISDRIMDVIGQGLGIITDLIFLPFEWIYAGLGILSKVLKKGLSIIGKRLSILLSLDMENVNLIFRVILKIGFLFLPRTVRKMLLQAGIDQPMFEHSERDRMSIVMRFLILIPFLLFVLFPLYWVVTLSFKTTPQISARTSIFWPDPWTIEQYTTLINGTPFIIWFRNTVIVAIFSTTISVMLAALGAYALTRLKFRGAGTLTTALLVTYLLPGTLLFIPLYQTLTDLGLINTYGALILTYPTFLLPFATWVMMGYFRTIPVDLEEAAMIDGASRLRAFWSITLPLAAPALGAVTLLAFTNAWNEFLFAFVFINSESLRTLPVGLQSMIVGDILPWGQLMAASLLMAIPVVVIYSYAQRFLAEGLTIGAVKG